MKNLYLIFIWTPIISFGQQVSAILKEVSEKFILNYNASEYEKIFDLFGNDMQEYLPLEKTTGFLKGLKNQAGAIDSAKFVRYVVF